jgi:uncharacterized protein YqeY
MNIKNTVEEALKVAIKSGNETEKETLRAIKSEFTKLETSGSKFDETDYLKTIQKMVKQRNESYDIFTKQNREDLASKEMAQIKVLETFLPKQLSQDEIIEVVKTALDELGLVQLSRKEFGKVMGVIRPKVAGKADNKAVSEIINRYVID